MDLILVVNKPKFFTSNDVIKKIKSHANIKKIGHGGTLDPYATGVLIIGVNKATKLLANHLNNSKEYIAVIQFGFLTQSYDLQSNVIEAKQMTIKLDDIKRILDKFVFHYDQCPPVYSAIKINGQRAYKYAHKGDDINLKPRLVKLNNYEILSFENNILVIKIDVSKGFYVRSLAYDLGNELNGCATLIDLIRTRSGEYTLDQAISIDQAIKILKDNPN